MMKQNLSIDISVDKGITISKINNNGVVTHIYLKSIVLGLILGVINGFFGGGGGMIAVPVLQSIFKLEDKVAHATTLFIMLPLSVVSSIVYYLYHGLEYRYMFITICSIVLGGSIGAVILKKINNKVLGILFSIVIIYGGIRLVL